MFKTIRRICSRLIERVHHGKGMSAPLLTTPVKRYIEATQTGVDSYWGEHTVNSRPFRTPQESVDYLEWRCEEYPLLREFMGLYGQHDTQVVLDYGCGPGDDLIGFLLHTKAKKVIGMDISEKALSLAGHRVALHNISSERAELVQISDAVCRIPVEDQVVDYINSGGVIHHTSTPDIILKEFYRILRPRSQARIMVYNRNSLWFHLYTAYDKMVLHNAFPGLTLEEAFARNTDGEQCPISRPYRPDEFIDLCCRAGFETEFLGGYLSRHELQLFQKLAGRALGDERLEKEHKMFLGGLTLDDKGYPLYEGKHAGIGGVYVLWKR
ncbi:MAG: class I SAM-dependent methyltransferase [Nitrospira sp.]